MDRQPYYALFNFVKREQRLTLFRDTLSYSFSAINRLIDRHTGIKNGAKNCFGEKRIENFVNAYVEDAIDYKIKNGMSPEVRIRPSKIAAISINKFRAVLDSDLVQFSNILPVDHPYNNFLRAIIYNKIVYVCLGIDSGFFDTIMGQDIYKLFMRHTSKDQPSVEYLCIMFELLHQQSGDQQTCLSGD